MQDLTFQKIDIRGVNFHMQNSCIASLKYQELHISAFPSITSNKKIGTDLYLDCSLITLNSWQCSRRLFPGKEVQLFL